MPKNPSKILCEYNTFRTAKTESFLGCFTLCTYNLFRHRMHQNGVPVAFSDRFLTAIDILTARKGVEKIPQRRIRKNIGMYYDSLS